MHFGPNLIKMGLIMTNKVIAIFGKTMKQMGCVKELEVMSTAWEPGSMSLALYANLQHDSRHSNMTVLEKPVL